VERKLARLDAKATFRMRGIQEMHGLKHLLSTTDAMLDACDAGRPEKSKGMEPGDGAAGGVGDTPSACGHLPHKGGENTRPALVPDCNVEDGCAVNPSHLSGGGGEGRCGRALVPPLTDGEIGQPDIAVAVKRSPAFLARADQYDWRFNARDAQVAPRGDWRVWLLMGGRGSGKTRAGAEWVHFIASRTPELRIALVAETLGDAREVMIDGVSGICRIAREKRPDFEASRRRLVWPNGSIGQIFSSEDPESLRGPQFHLAWCDDLHYRISCTASTCAKMLISLTLCHLLIPKRVDETGNECSPCRQSEVIWIGKQQLTGADNDGTGNCNEGH
jgi:hypothetical protein